MADLKTDVESRHRAAIAAAKARIADLRSELKDTQRAAEAAEQAESDRADAEKDRADGAEAHAKALLAESINRRADELGYDSWTIPDHVLDSIVDLMWDELEHGVKARDLSPDSAITDWAEGR